MADNPIFCGSPLDGPALRVENPDGVSFVERGGNVRHSLYNGPNPVPNLPGDYENVRQDPGRP